MGERRSVKGRNASLDEVARRILKENDFGTYTVPTRELYPFQWNWDACLNALGWATFDEARAWTEMRALFSGQWDDGMLPHIVFHRDSPSYFPGPGVWQTGKTPASSGISQPPVAATAVRFLLEATRDLDNAEKQAEQLLPNLFRYHQWWRGARDPKGTGLVAVLHPWESGWDNSPAWDEALAAVPLEGLEPFERKDTEHVGAEFRPTQENYNGYIALLQQFRRHGYDPRVLYDISPFRVADLCVNSVLLRADQDLSWLAERFGQPEIAAAAKGWFLRGKEAFQGLWDDASSMYRTRDLVSGRLVPAQTAATFLALYAGVVPSHKLTTLMETYDRWIGTTRYAVSTISGKDASFDSKRYWRGPIWPHMNFLIADGLARYGYREHVGRIVNDTVELIEKAGFFEYFDPRDGSGAGGRDFSWTAALWLAWLS
jgi:glycogen debranching enzyme